jgi:hypothetical protein
MAIKPSILAKEIGSKFELTVLHSSSLLQTDLIANN